MTYQEDEDERGSSRAELGREAGVGSYCAFRCFDQDADTEKRDTLSDE